MASQQRTKPWEVTQGKSAASTTAQVPSTTTIPTATTTTTAPITNAPETTANPTTSLPPSIPERPASLSSEFNTLGESSPYGGMGGYGNSAMNRYGSNMYGGGYGSSMYGGGYGSSMYGGYGSSMYGGGYGSGMYGGGYGSGMYGGGYGNQPMMSEGSQQTFQLIESIIGAVGGFAQMLEATYFATQSSFFAITNVAAQFSAMGNAIGSILGIFTLKKLLVKILNKIRGIKPNLSLAEFQKFQGAGQQQLQNSQNKKRSFRFLPLLFFVGVPILLTKLINRLQEQQQKRQQEEQQQQQRLPEKIQFARSKYQFTPENPQLELELGANEIIAILDTNGGWSKVRNRGGTMGWVPSNYLEIINRP
ncbi:Peroxisomal membrane protein, putative [Candida maltosa Xu316]|uniref:Peroxisomal membrane protein PEX13 n=1 Tax=Candida maltosa (strain Xu316) TaxID=1245528 RepID=M3HDU3_CANMX|nr:Peroxisomal membrane protein, putative [Candida maltosa Xu316]